MKESDANARKRTDPRPNYIELGDDTDGASHVYRLSRPSASGLDPEGEGRTLR